MNNNNNNNNNGIIEWNADDDEEYGVDGPSFHNNNGILSYSSPYSIYSKFPPPPVTEWKEIGRERSFIPQTDDVGRLIRIECTPYIKKDKDILYGPLARIFTSAVLPVPVPPPARQSIYNANHPHLSALLHARSVAGSPNAPLPSVYKVLCYNVLAQIYATSTIYPYTPIWALQWEYRKTVLLREILSHNADIVCLQEVQSDHFETFFLPSMQKAGYDGIFKAKTRESFTDSAGSIDGCATFFKRDRFALMEQYGIEYNEAARQQVFEKRALRRLLKGNIALVLVLEELDNPSTPSGRKGKKRRFCTANTHIYWDPEFADVKLWQSWVLSRELEKLVLGRNLPLILCGDFNSLVESSVYELLARDRVNEGSDIYQGNGDPYHILPSDLSQISHHLQLDSAYAVGVNEPRYTNYTGHFVGVLDYVFFTRQHFRLVSCLEVDTEENLRTHTALPSPYYSSDHIALVTELELTNNEQP